MLGGTVLDLLSQEHLDVLATSRRPDAAIRFAVDVDMVKKSERLLQSTDPDYVINCIGIIRPGDEPDSIRDTFMVNSRFPQVLSALCQKRGARLIHISTDGVFSGQKGRYREDDIPDDHSVYGVSKFLGESQSLPHVTLRTSIVGYERNQQRNLLNRFLSNQQRKIFGYANVYWNGVTTITLAKIISKIITEDLTFTKPLLHIASTRVSKYELLQYFKDAFHKDIVIVKCREPRSDRTLVPSVEQSQYFKDLILPLKTQISELNAAYGQADK